MAGGACVPGRHLRRRERGVCPPLCAVRRLYRGGAARQSSRCVLLQRRDDRDYRLRPDGPAHHAGQCPGLDRGVQRPVGPCAGDGAGVLEVRPADRAGDVQQGRRDREAQRPAVPDVPDGQRARDPDRGGAGARLAGPQRGRPGRRAPAPPKRSCAGTGSQPDFRAVVDGRSSDHRAEPALRRDARIARRAGSGTERLGDRVGLDLRADYPRAPFVRVGGYHSRCPLRRTSSRRSQTARRRSTTGTSTIGSRSIRSARRGKGFGPYSRAGGATGWPFFAIRYWRSGAVHGAPVSTTRAPSGAYCRI